MSFKFIPLLARPLILCTFICLANYVSGQKYSFKNYNALNGLGSSNINHIFQDSKGYIWFATQGGGASRFNGREFRNFTKTDGLISNDVTFITEDRNRNIWIGTAEGAAMFDGTVFKNLSEKDGLPKGVVYCIYAGSDNRIWFAIKGGGINIFDGRKFSSLTMKEGLPSNDAYSIINDKSGNYWFGLANGIAMYNGKQIINYNNVNYIEGKTFFSSLYDKNGNIWFGSTTGDVVMIGPGKTPQPVALPSNLRSDFIGSITQDRTGNIWFATDHGALKYSQGVFTLFNEKNGLSINSVQALICDYEGNIWIGTLDGGVNLLHSEAFADYTPKDGLGMEHVTSISREQGTLRYYVGTAGDGLYILDFSKNQKFKKIEEVKEIKNINISSLSSDVAGLVWISAQEGIFVLKREQGTFRCIKKYNKIAGGNVISPTMLTNDSKGNCWIATYGSGVFEINGAAGAEKHYGIKNLLPSDNILTVFKDSKANIWIGTQDAGIIKYNGRVFEKFNPQDAFAEKAVWSIAESNKGTMFFGTGESGLYCFNGKKIVSYALKDGICSNYVTALQWDSTEDCLWVGTEKGVNKLHLNEDMSLKSISTYDNSKGFNLFGVCQNAILADNNDLVWFGSVNGLWCYNRRYDIATTVPPKIQITGIRLAYQKVDWKNYADSLDKSTGLPVNLTLSYKNNHLTFNIQALTTGNALYTYKLEGQDDDWSPLTENNEANYSNIAPGNNYVFKAKAVNANGISSDQIISFAFVITPPWWKTWWFRITTSLIGLILIAGFIRAREVVLKTQNLKLEKTVTQRTSELVQQKQIVEEKNIIITLEKEKSDSLLQQTEELNHELAAKNIALEQLDSEKNNLLNIVAHDLKNPLGLVRTFAEISADPETSEEKRQGYLQNIAVTTDRMYELVNNLLDENSIESGKIVLNITNVNLNELITEYANVAGVLAKKRDIGLLVQLPPSTIYIKTDRARLGQVIENYISNALKYSPGGTSVYIALNALSDYIEILVRDEGPGIDEHEKGSLFKSYGVTGSMPLYGETKTGLGLSIVKKIADMLHATAGFSSEKGKGSEFYIRLPFDEKKPN